MKETKEGLKIYVWEEDFLFDYISGLAVVIANSETEAIETLKAQILDIDAGNYGVHYKTIELRIKDGSLRGCVVSKEHLEAIDEGPDEVYDISKKAFWIAGGE